MIPGQMQIGEGSQVAQGPRQDGEPIVGDVEPRERGQATQLRMLATRTSASIADHGPSVRIIRQMQHVDPTLRQSAEIHKYPRAPRRPDPSRPPGLLHAPDRPGTAVAPGAASRLPDRRGLAP
jgi:hypothetical protein